MKKGSVEKERRKVYIKKIIIGSLVSVMWIFFFFSLGTTYMSVPISTWLFVHFVSGIIGMAVTLFVWNK